MSHALSLDLRRRVIAAAEAVQSHRAVAERFGVSAASVSGWRAIARREGEPRPKALSGDRRSGAVERAGPTIFALIERAPDITIEELRAELAGKGMNFGFGAIRRFFAWHAITR